MRWRSRIVPITLAVLSATVPAGTVAAVASAAGARHVTSATDPPVTNPFAGAHGYVDPDWSASVRAAAAQGGDLAPAMTAVSHRPTAVWLDSIAAVDGTPARRGLRAHLDAALAQQDRDGTPVVITLVLYNLPNRSCAHAPTGELTVPGDGLTAYRTRFIDPITTILSDPAYRALRIATVVEPDSLGNQITTSYPWYECEQARQAGVYLDAIPYALSRLHELPHVSAYLDVTASNQIGWPGDLQAAATLVRAAADRTPGGVGSVDGFAVNVADYDPVDEPFLDIGMTRNGVPIIQTRWVDWNDHLEESTFVDAMHARLVAAGFPDRIGALVDTSRNGWGGPARPVAPSVSTDINTFVDQSKVDRRQVRFTWCNQAGAGLGEPPRATPRPHVHAYAWVKQPGISDGSLTQDVRCDPHGEMPPPRGTSRPTNAMAGAPPRGEWFPAAFTGLVRNAYPPVG
ncbi:glycoside hydrolase family 6 protein [Catenuloplanes japonicus]|uniref:glycoside hydrolase family 6 protein n=1 Tax=Catenuloplanes japonicus TaxID=33876 RepID=UPI00068D02D2|nr:glycoside hydrolase family 6 protein [Catenuloplanes japonicus]